MKFLIAFSAAILWSTSALACYTAPDDAKTSALELVNRAHSIVLARVVSAEDSAGAYSLARFEFETVETLSGNPPRRFELDGFHRDPNVAMPQDFHGHVSEEFDVDTTGNSVILTSCEIFGIFEVGETYLVFDVEQAHFKAYENIKREDDHWLVKIQAIIKRSS